MDINLDKVDQVRERTGVSYREAREALEKTDGDVVEAIIYLEDRKRGWQERFQVRGQDLVERVKEIIHQGNVTRIRVRQGDKVLLEFPVSVGVVGVLLLPTLAALGVVAALVTQCTIEVERHRQGNDAQADEGETVVIRPETMEKQ